jgi:hypothetical protein
VEATPILNAITESQRGWPFYQGVGVKVYSINKLLQVIQVHSCW